MPKKKKVILFKTPSRNIIVCVDVEKTPRSARNVENCECSRTVVTASEQSCPHGSKISKECLAHVRSRRQSLDLNVNTHENLYPDVTRPEEAKYIPVAPIIGDSGVDVEKQPLEVDDEVIEEPPRDDVAEDDITREESLKKLAQKLQHSQLQEHLKRIDTQQELVESSLKNRRQGCFKWLFQRKRVVKPIPPKAPSPDQPPPKKRKQSAGPHHVESYYNIKSKKHSAIFFIPLKVYNYGEKGSGYQSKGAAQDFYELRDQCLQRNELFEDPEFPATNSSLFFSQRPDRYFEWKRPGELVDDPQLFVEGFSRFDVQQGELGDCWLLAAVANLTLYRRLFFQIVPDDQGFEENYAGIFHFRFWQYGRWIDVVIDDRLPTYRGQLVFLHSTEENEFWSALLEKAYAKLHGSYEALKGGSTCEAMEDFTGGVTEMYEMNATPPNLFKIIAKAYERWSLMGCSIEPDPDVVEAQTPEGLIRGHAYSITKVQYVNIQTPNVAGKIPLLRLRNPWGNDSEWNGAWSDNSPEWRYISDEDKAQLGLTFDADGEFWMSFKDFTQHFSRLEICNLNPDSLSEDELTEGRNKKWVMSVFEGEWVRGVTAGGCRNFLDTFAHNPQYRVTLSEVDENDEDQKCTMIVGLMQKNRRQIRATGVDLLTVGFAIYYLPSPDRVPKPLDTNFFRFNASVARSPSFINLREVSCRFKLPPGTYCIVPSTFDPNEEGEFLLRVFSEHQNNMQENDLEVGLKKDTKATKLHSPKINARENQKAQDLFNKVANENKEIGWQGLKEILDEYTKLDDSDTVKVDRSHGVNATPTVPQTGEVTENNVFTAILGLLCGAFCKDTPLADLVPPPTHLDTLHKSYFEMHNKGFSKDICRSMIAMLDTDRSGKLDYSEFQILWESINKWKEAFTSFDKNNSGTLSGFELREALNSAGYNLNNNTLNVLMHRYGNKNCELEFDDFMMCAVKLKTMIELFNASSSQGPTASFTMERWIEITLYA